MPIAASAGSMIRPLFLLAFVLLFTPVPLMAQPAGRAACFDTSALSPALQARSETLLLEALDTEHLYTLATGLKPMSAGFFGAEIAVNAPQMTIAQARDVAARYSDADVATLGAAERADLELAQRVLTRDAALQDIEDVRTILATWRCGDQIHADLLHYANPRDGTRALHAVVFALPSVRQVVADKAPFFSRWAFTESASPIEIVNAIEYARDATRFAGYGYLFGYPDEAVHFFAAAATSQDVTGEFVVRDFRAIPTFQRDTGQFTYAVPKGAVETAADRALSAQAARILSAYKARRVRYIGEGKPGPAALLRDWFCSSDDSCNPSAAPL